jgi:hypothetical protein
MDLKASFADEFGGDFRRPDFYRVPHVKEAMRLAEKVRSAMVSDLDAPLHDRLAKASKLVKRMPEGARFGSNVLEALAKYKPREALDSELECWVHKFGYRLQ